MYFIVLIIQNRPLGTRLFKELINMNPNPLTAGAAYIRVFIFY